MEMKVTVEMLAWMHACQPQRDAFEDLYPDGFVVNVNNATKLIHEARLQWAYFVFGMIEDSIDPDYDGFGEGVRASGEVFDKECDKASTEYIEKHNMDYTVFAEITNVNRINFDKGLISHQEWERLDLEAEAEYDKASDELRAVRYETKDKALWKHAHTCASLSCKIIRRHWKHTIKEMKEVS